MDADVAELVRRERIAEAAELASSRGDAMTAADLFERACDFGRASREAMRAGRPDRALCLAVVAADAESAQRALDAVRAKGEAALARVAAELEQRGDHAWAARAFEAALRSLDAARAWEHAGEAVRSASLYERGNDPVAASKVLEAALRREPSRHDCQVALGKLLLRYGKHEAGVRALQQVPAGAPERRAALAGLVTGLGALGLSQAADAAARELESLGGAPPEATPAPQGEVKRRMYGRYDVVRDVASTATARVIECVDSVRGERVAVKVFAGYDVRGAGRDALMRFEREVRVLAAIDHPNVVPLRDFFPDGPALVLAWMSGGTLEHMMQSPIAPARAVEIAEAVLSALGEAHRHGVLHRDIKPANVLFDDAGVARLADFGVAHLGDLTATATAGVIGTLAYMSPEQREGKPATVQSDLYGVGAILFEMLTGERLVLGEEPRTRPSGVHRDLDVRHDEVVLGMLAVEREQRPPDAFSARRRLSALHWPSTVERAAPQAPRERERSERPGAVRLVTGPDGVTTDTLAGRRLQRVPLTDRTLGRAGAFARAGEPVLQTVLRADRAAGEIWLDEPRGKPIDRPLHPQEQAALTRALDALHGQGVVHGHVDRAHVLVAETGGVLLRFEPASDPTATADTDWAQLRRLGAP